MEKPHHHDSQPRIRLTEARNARGWSQVEVAERIGTTYVNVSRWERGITRPSPYFRKKLAALYGKSEQELDLTPDLPLDALSTTNSINPVPSNAGEQDADKQRPYYGTGLVGGGNDARLSTMPPLDALYDPTIPLPLAIHLVGREGDLARARARLCGGSSVALTALNGLPGVGKTALMITLAHDPAIRIHFTSGILWAGLGPNPTMQSHLSRWGTLLGLSSSEMSTLQGSEAWAVALRRAIGSRRFLLVIDDAWTLDDALLLKVGGPNCAHLLTTRFPAIATQIAADGATPIRELSNDEGMVLLRMLAPQVVESETQRARELVEAVGGLPLALNLIGNYLRMQSYTGQTRRVTAALQRLSDAGARLDIGEPRGPAERHPSLAGDTPVSLRTVISVTDQQLEPASSAALHALSVFPPRPNSFSEEAALTIAACPVETLDLLTDTGLLETSGGDRYSLHQTIADYARLQLADHAPHERLIAYATAYAEQNRKAYDLLESESSNILAALEAAAELGHESELIRAACAFAPYLLARGLYPLAETHLQRAYQAATRQDDRSGLASTLLYLGEMAQKQGNYEQAGHYLQEGLEHARAIKDNDRICAILANLGTVSWKTGKHAQAETYLQEGLTLARELNNSERISELLTNLGSVSTSQSAYAQAEIYLQEGLEIARRIYNREQICTILIVLGAIEGQQGSYEQAEAYLQEGLSLARQLGHRERISGLLSNLGDIAGEQGHYGQAEKYFSEGLEVAQQIEQREWTSFLLLNLALVNRKQGNHELAEKYSQESLILARQIGIPQITSIILYECGNLYLEQQQSKEAETAFREMLTLIPGGSQDLSALAQYGLARVLAEQGKFEEAIKLGGASVAILEAIGHRNTEEVKQWLEAQDKTKP